MNDFNFQQNKLDYISPKRNRFKKPLFYVFVGLLLVGISYFVLHYKIGRVLTHGNSEQEERIFKENPLPESEDERFDVLILGIRGEDDIENGGLLTDTIQILSLDKNTKKASLISIPRDLYVKIGDEEVKINQIYEMGLVKKEGLSFVSKIVSSITGVYIDKTIVFDFKAFQDIVESLGGVDVYLAKEFKESTQWGYDFHLPAGQNHLNGEQALYYVRSRYSSNDFDRARRQQQVMTAIKNKAFSLGLLANPIKISSLFSSLKRNIRTDLQIWDLNNLLTLANSFGDKKQIIKNYVISADNLLIDARSSKGEYILLPKTGNYDEIKLLFKNILIN